MYVGRRRRDSNCCWRLTILGDGESMVVFGGSHRFRGVVWGGLLSRFYRGVGLEKYASPPPSPRSSTALAVRIFCFVVYCRVY